MQQNQLTKFSPLVLLFHTTNYSLIYAKTFEAFQFKWSCLYHSLKKAVSTTGGELPNSGMGWRRAANTGSEAVDLFLRLMSQLEREYRMLKVTIGPRIQGKRQWYDVLYVPVLIDVAPKRSKNSLGHFFWSSAKQ